MKRNHQLALLKAGEIMKRRQAAINAVEGRALELPASYFGKHDVITELNADLLTEGTYREALTTYAVGYPLGTLQADVEFFAPGVQVASRFDYKAFSNVEAFLSELQDDLRAPGGDFKEVEFTVEEITAKTANRGLMVAVDRDQVKEDPNWEQRYTAMLMRRIMLNKVRRAIALLSAAATNTDKTWDTSAGKNPDGDVRADIVTAHTAAGVRPNRVGYGPTAWSLRQSSHEAQDNAGGYAAAARTPQQLAQYLAIEQVLICEARYATSATAKAAALANLVLMFNALSGATVEDPSNVKGFYSLCENGQPIQVHRWDMGPKKLCIGATTKEL